MVDSAKKLDILELVMSDILYLANSVVGTRTFFVARLKNGNFHVSKILNNNGIDLEADQTVSYEESLCQHVNVENYRKPLIIEDTLFDDRVKDQWVPKEFKIRSYLAIPIELKDETFYGTLCAADPSPYSFGKKEIEDMKRLAELYAKVIDLTLQNPLKEDRVIRLKNLSVVGELSAELADRIGNPLQIIKGFLDISKKDNNIQKYLELIESEVNNIEKALSEFLLQTSPKYPNKKEVNITSILSDFLNSIEVNKYSNIKIDLNVNLPFPNVVIDEEQMKFVMKNIIMNAIESIKEDSGHIHIQCYSFDNSIMVEVKDNGKGILLSDLHRISQPFYTTKDNAKGLGLTMASKIIEGHEGEVTIDSNSKGTKVCIRLPFSK